MSYVATDHGLDDIGAVQAVHAVSSEHASLSLVYFEILGVAQLGPTVESVV